MKTPIPAIVESVHESDIREINSLESSIIHSEDDADDKLWQQAGRVVALLDAGMTQRALAAQPGSEEKRDQFRVR